MSETRLIHGFHAVTAKLRHAADDVREITVAEGRQDGRMRDLLKLAASHGVRVILSDAKRLDGLAGGTQHQGVVAKVSAQAKHVTLDDVLDGLAEPPLLLVLDGITDPHNLGACLRVADAAGAHAVVAPKDKACGLNATAIKVASGAADTVPYIVVTNLARSLREMQERGIWVIGAAGEADKELYAIDQKGPCAWVLGAEGRRHAPPDARNLRRSGADPDARQRGEPQRVGLCRHLPVRGAAPARRLRPPGRSGQRGG
jgi:23S rRNA (guanosine2251-2'-O)-methyltransferase